MDWFLEEPLDLYNLLREDQEGCHPNQLEHQEAVERCIETLRVYGITNASQFTGRWPTSEILSGLDALLGQELQGNEISRPAGWLWSYLQKGEAASLDPAGYPGRSSEVVNSIVRELKRRGFSHPGYLVVTYPLEAILDAVNAVDTMGSRGIEVGDVPGLVNLWLESSEEKLAGEDITKREILTPAEIDLLGLISRGLGNKEIAQELNISEYTVTNRITSTLTKLGAKNRAHALVIALRKGIIDLPEDVDGQG